MMSLFQCSSWFCDRLGCQYCLFAIYHGTALHAGGQQNHPNSAQCPSQHQRPHGQVCCLLTSRTQDWTGIMPVICIFYPNVKKCHNGADQSMVNHHTTCYLKGNSTPKYYFHIWNLIKDAIYTTPYIDNYLCLFFHSCIIIHFVFCIITHMGDSILNKTFSTFSKWLPERFVNSHNTLYFLFGVISNMAERFCTLIDRLQICW